MKDQLVSGGEAARMLGVSRPTIARWVRKGRLRGFVEARTTRVWLSSLKAKAGARVGTSELGG